MRYQCLKLLELPVFNFLCTVPFDSRTCIFVFITGFMIFVRGAVQYAKVKYEWQKLRGHIRRYYFF